MKKNFTLALFLFFIMCLATLPPAIVKANYKTIIVPNDYPTIQAAVNNASQGDTIFVKTGTYYETLVINKSITLIGEDQETTFINANKTTKDIIYINASEVTIQGFTICNNNGYQASVPEPNGIQVDYKSSDINILNNTITSIQYGDGILFYYVSESKIIGNNITAPGGIYIGGGSGNNLTNNVVTSGGCHLTTTSTNNKIIGNYFGNDTYNYGLQLDNDCSNNIVVGNTFAYNEYGLALEPPSSNTFYDNNFEYNAYQVLLFGRKGDWAGLVNLWDNGTEGNYWSDYSGNGSQTYTIIANWDQNVVYYDKYPRISPFNASSSTPTPPMSYSFDQAALSRTAQTVNSAGVATISFAPGTQVKFLFILDLTTGSSFIIWRITLQQPDQSGNTIVSTNANISTTPNIYSYEQLIPAGVPTGNWTAAVQIFHTDGLTPLGVTVLTFTVT